MLYRGMLRPAPNLGQKILNPEPESDGSTRLKSCFRIARVTRPLMLVGKICDSGTKVEFDDTKATVRAPDNSEVCIFERKPGGLYICQMKLKQPSYAGIGCGSRLRFPDL